MTLFACPRELVPVLDIAKVADLIVYAFDVEQGIDDDGLQILNLLIHQGMPTAMGVLLGSENVPLKKRHEVKKAVSEAFCRQFAEEPRVVPVDNITDAEQLVRFASQQKLRDIWRDRRPYMLVEQFQFHPNPANPEFGTLSLAGYTRGAMMDVNMIVHLTGIGDFQLDSIVAPQDPHPFKRGDSDVVMGGLESHVVAQPDAGKQQTLQTKNVPDEMANEQTWPTEAELAEAERTQSLKKRRVPKGTSQYQAAWIPDLGGDSDIESDSFEDEDGDDMDDRESEDEDGEEAESESEELQNTQVRVDGNKGTGKGKSVRFQDDAANDGDLGDDEMEADAEAEQKRHRSRRSRTEDEEIEDDLHFTDEVDIDEDHPGRFRFHKYRGLRSFRTSPWDPKENLPFDFSRIFQFENFRGTKKRVLSTHFGLSAGSWLCLNLRDVHVGTLSNHAAQHPLILSGLFQFEQKMSAINYTVAKVGSYPHPLRSKEELWFHVGFRRFKACPIFSEHAHNSDKFKLSKFLHDSTMSVATILGPITFPPMPITVWKELQPGRPLLCATGGVLSVNPDRIVLKKVVLTGKPFRVRNRRAVIRGMFHNPEDIKWFKPIELWTKKGLTGHIAEPLGTHGYMKCTFSGKLDHGDTVCLSLYKRVFPSFATLPSPPRPYTIPGDDVVAPENR